MAEEIKLNVKLNAEFEKLQKQKESLQAKGALNDPKKLQQINAWFNELKRVINELDPKQNQQLTTVRSQFKRLTEELGKASLKAETLSKDLKELYSKREKVQDKINSRADTKSNLLSRGSYDKNGRFRLAADDSEVKSIITKAGVKAASNGRLITNADTMRRMVDEGTKNGWQGTFKTQGDFTKAKQAVTDVDVKTQLTADDLKSLDLEIENLTKDLQELDNQIAQKKSTEVVAPEYSKTQEVATEVSSLVNEQKSQNAAQEGQERVNQGQLESFNTALNKQSSSLGKAFKQFSIYAIALRTTKKAISAAVKTIKDLDKYLTEQAMVTGKTREQTYGLLKSYQKLASVTGATTKEVAEVATQFMRQGKTAKEALTLTEAAVKAAKVAGISATESVNYLTTALNGFQLQAEDAMRVSDKFAAVAAQSATSYEEIAIALSKVASQANMAGMSIDYTTALLAKGIETTREAPETIGTALKTVIARMRELTDYGETLEGDTDVNNVETQLAYIGIALRNEEGALRSTEDVLDELGKKWDTLNSNQQAAVAKALAGTRQQSRLIAMMSDYERTVELQQIAQRSAGATAAQASTYMEGMEAALNKVSVAWEKIVTAVTNSDIIIGLIDDFAGLLDTIGNILDSTVGMVGFITIIATIGLTILGQKMAELSIAKQQRKFSLQQQKTELENKNIRDKAFISANKERIEKEKAALAQAKATIIELKSQKVLTAEQQNSLATAEKYVAENEARIEQESAQLKVAELSVSTYQQQNQLLEGQTSLLGNLGNLMSGITTPLLLAITLYKTIAGWIVKVRTLRSASHKKEMAEQGAETTANAMGAAGKIISNLGIWGIPLAIAVVAALVGTILGISAAVKETKKNSLQGLTDDINSLSANIYKLTEKANGIKTITDQYAELDEQIIKTKEDQEEMNKLLDSATDKLSDEEKAIYDTLTTNDKKLQYLAQIEQKARNEANENRKQQLRDLAKMKSSDRDKVLSSTDNSDYLQVQDAIFAINNNTLYEYIDSLETVSEGTETFTQSILENLSAQEAYAYATDKTGVKIKELTDTINSATTSLEGNTVAYAEILQSDNYNFSQKIEAYNKLHDVLASVGDPVILTAFEKTYQQWERLNESLAESINYIDKMGITIEEINNLGKAIQDLGYSTEEATGKLNDMFQRLEAGGDLERTIKTLFAQDLAAFDYGSKEWKATYNKILNAYQGAVGQGALNMGQNLTKLTNQINDFYDKATKWSGMTEQEKTEFMSDNYKLFEGESGQRLYRAFETGDYNEIQRSLANNEALKETIKLRLQELQVDLDIEKARRATGEANEAYIAELEKNIKELENYEDETSKIYQASLELRLEQEKSQLDIYKDYLSKQQEALEESLNKRKEAYQKYFDAVNQEYEDEDYEEQANLLITNLQKLSSSTDANSKQQSKELEKQLQDLEKERLQTLRERAQEAVMNNIDDEVSQINEKFDKLLENNQAMLIAMRGDAADASSFIANTLSSNLEGKTALEAESYIQDFKAAYGSILPSSALDNISITENGDQLILNIAGTEIQIGEAVQQDLYSIIMNALKQQGLR